MLFRSHAKRNMQAALASEWGRLFQNWEKLTPDARGFPDVGTSSADFQRSGLRSFAASMKILATCMREAPEIAARRRRIAAAAGQGGTA